MRTSVSSVAARAGSVARSPRARRILGWTIGLLAAFAALGFLVAPPIAKAKLEEGLSRALHRQVTLEAVRVNPFAPSVTLRGLRVRSRANDAPLAGFDELYANLAWTSIFHLAPVVDEIRLTRPQLRLVRDADRKYNVQDLIDAFLARPKSEAPAPRFAFFNIEVLDGRIEFDDRAEKERHALTGLRIGVPFVSSFPADREIKVLPGIAGKLNGASFDVKGESLPFSDTRATTLSLDLDAFDVTRLVNYLPFGLRARLRSALLDAHLVLSFEQPGGKARLTLRGRSALRQFDLADPEGRPLVAWQRLGVEIGAVDPFAPRVALERVEVDGARVDLRRGRDGTLNLLRIVPAATSSAQTSARAAAGASPRLALKIARLVLKSARLHFRDETSAPAFETLLEDLALEGRAIDSASGTRSTWTLQARTDAGETIKLSAAATLEPLGADGRVDLGNVQLKRYQPYLRPVANLELDDGRLDAGIAVRWGEAAARKAAALKIADLALTLTGLRMHMPNERQPLLQVRSIELKGGAADFAARRASLGEIAVRGFDATLRRERDGRLNLERIAKAVAGRAATKPSGPAWQIDLGRFSLERGALALEDRALGDEPVRMRVAPLQLTAQDFSTARGRAGRLSLRATIDRRGTLAASGRVTLDPPSGRLRVDARAIDLVPVQRYVDDRVNLTLSSGRLSARGTASFALRPGGATRASYRGDLSITDFASIDKRSTQDLLNWKTLSLGAIDFELAPMKLSLDEIALADFYARIIVLPQGRINLQDLVVAKDAAQAAAGPLETRRTPAAKPRSPDAAASAEAAARKVVLPPNVRIGRVSLQGGNVNFSDFYIKPNYSANLTGVTGSVAEMTPDRAGSVELRGKIDDAAPVEIAGSVNPLSPELFVDLKADARDVELPPLSPYAIKYAGYGITRGKLSMHVKYHLENRRLVAENNLNLDQLTFGEKVESPTATNLPVLLAVALLKDRNGVIDIDLPISGSLDDPKFSLGGIIVKVIVNLIVKAITAPFALLGSMFGGGEQLAYVEFAPGRAALDAGAHEKLAHLAKALVERPGLKLDISGRADPAQDREALKRVSIERKVKTQKFNELRREGTAPAAVEAVTVAPAEYGKYLKRAYGAEKFPKPRNLIGLAKDLPVPEMEKLMLANTEVSGDDLRRLANRRAQAAKAWLTAAGKVAAERVFIVAPKLSAEGITDKGRTTRADFSLK
jgi:uncharacterized protein involved in outer membrane biogenesis